MSTRSKQWLPRILLGLLTLATVYLIVVLIVGLAFSNGSAS
jgi:hypothetical protein